MNACHRRTSQRKSPEAGGFRAGTFNRVGRLLSRLIRANYDRAAANVSRRAGRNRQDHPGKQQQAGKPQRHKYLSI
jgi:hypothetical protein